MNDAAQPHLLSALLLQQPPRGSLNAEVASLVRLAVSATQLPAHKDLLVSIRLTTTGPEHYRTVRVRGPIGQGQADLGPSPDGAVVELTLPLAITIPVEGPAERLYTFDVSLTGDQSLTPRQSGAPSLILTQIPLRVEVVPEE